MNNLREQLTTVITQHLNKSTYRFEDGFIGLIIDTVPKRVVYCIVLSLSCSNVLHKPKISLSYCTQTHKMNR